MKPMVIVIPSYNNRHWYQQNLGSVCAQAYDHFRALYVDDGSSDQTGALVEQFLADQAGGHRIELIRNPVRVGALANLYRMIHNCADQLDFIQVGSLKTSRQAASAEENFFATRSLANADTACRVVAADWSVCTAFLQARGGTCQSLVGRSNACSQSTSCHCLSARDGLQRGAALSTLASRGASCPVVGAQGQPVVAALAMDSLRP
jgi:hypothetical protein